MRTGANFDTQKPDKLYESLVTPSVVNTYSIGMQYIKDWFFSKFDKDFFKATYVEQQHPLADFRQINTITKALKKTKPSVAIGSQISYDFNRDTLDLYQASSDTYLRRTKFNNAFFRDKEKNLNLSVVFKVLEINFSFKIRLSTRAQQLDTLESILLSFRVGSTQGEDITMDCHIPYPLMMQIASDAGFEIKEDKVVDVIGFVRYMNQHSVVPILYKYRTVNGKDEFFMRVSNLYTHISCLDFPSLDDGENTAQIYSNYVIELNVILKIPAPHFYAYHSTCNHEEMKNISRRTKGDTIGLYNIKIPTIPEVDEHGWNQYLMTEYYSDEINTTIDIDMQDLFNNSDISNTIISSRNMYLSPEIFMNLKFYTNGDPVKYEIDWDTFKVHLLEPIYSNIIQISVYVDINYVKSMIYNEENFKERYNKSIEDKK